MSGRSGCREWFEIKNESKVWWGRRPVEAEALYPRNYTEINRHRQFEVMKIWCSFGRFILAISILFTPKVLLAVEAFTGTYGINYGRIADNIPSPDKVITLLRAAKIKNVRIFDFDHSVLQAFSGTGLELVVGLPNGYVKDMSSNPDHALTWVKENVQAYLPETNIRGIAVGNEVLGGTDQSLFESLLGAVKNIHNATKELQLDHVVQISTAHSEAVFNNSYPPSSCTFKESIAQYMKPLLKFFSQTGSPFCLNAYPFLDYMNNPKEIDINYALFQSTQGIYDQKTDLHYDNMLDAEIDAAYAALEDAGYKKMEVIVTETGWASDGDQNEAAATVSNARTYNYNLRKRLAKRKGTPRRPKSVLKVYVFAMFNEDSKPGPASERNFGLFKADGNISYDIGFAGLKSSSATSFFLSLKDIQARGSSRLYSLILTACVASLLKFTTMQVLTHSS
ncbi:Glucan endo-1,3-beta-glucosidase 14 [Camellia lanceoleosa]|uniref:Glucan endo-1,3-beta-glucosidase 14 n=1 Tax=Camellia lanceoleosa TaxID=1840588 RepID=A0ACC0IFK9_9ERIC|nr:Glucan endo-1,3-beta-glucosidase 14 [Camellia lanceoleosa]